MRSARVTFMSEHSHRIRVLYKFLIFKRLIVRGRDTAYTEKNIKKAFESTGIRPLNPRTVLGKLSLSGANNHETSLAPIEPHLLLSHSRPQELSTTSSAMPCRWLPERHLSLTN